MPGYAKGKPKPETYVLNVGRDRVRQEVWSSLRKYAKDDGVPVTEPVWDALYGYVERRKRG